MTMRMIVIMIMIMKMSMFLRGVFLGRVSVAVYPWKGASKLGWYPVFDYD